MITINSAPALFNGAYNDNTFDIVSDNNNVIHFNVELYNSFNDSLIGRFKYFKAPGESGVSFSINQILIDYTATEIKNGNNIFYNLNGGFSYYLKITGIDSSNVLIEPAITSEINTVIDGYFDLFNNDLPENFIVDGVRQGKFLTDFNSNISQFVTTTQPIFYYLYSTIENENILLNFSTNKGLTGSRVINLKEGINSIKIKVEDFVSSDLDTFTFHLSFGQIQITESITLGIIKACKDKNLSIIYQNKKGGYDSLSIEKASLKLLKSATKTSIQNNKQNQLINGVYTSDRRVFKVNERFTYNVITSYLTKEEEIIHSNIISSKSVFIVLPDNLLLPINILNDSINVDFKTNKRRRINLSFDAQTPSFLNEKKNTIVRNAIEQLNYIINNFYSIINPDNPITII